MVSRADVEQVLDEIGPVDEEILSVLLTPEGTWVVSFEDFDVELSFDDETRRLSFLVAIGRAPEARAADVHGTLLRYNAIRHDTGVVMALDPDGAVIQSLDLFDARITAEFCAVVLRNFLTKARTWSTYMAASPGISGELDLIDFDPLVSLRV